MSARQTNGTKTQSLSVSGLEPHGQYVSGRVMMTAVLRFCSHTTACDCPHNLASPLVDASWKRAWAALVSSDSSTLYKS